MGGIGSGGANRKPVEMHVLHGTFRADRHTRPAAVNLSLALTRTQRRRLMDGLTDDAKLIVRSMLETFGDWDQASLDLLRALAVSLSRLREYEAAGNDDDRRRETRTALSLRRALQLLEAR